MKKETLEIYVYIHVKDGRVIYCGKGIKKVYNYGKVYDRAYDGAGRKYNVKEIEVFKVKYFDNEKDAYAYEEFLTSWYKKCGQCEYNIDIANKLGEKHRRKISESMKGEKNPMYGQGDKLKGENHPFYGKHHSEEARQKISESKKGKTGANCPNSIPVIAFTNSGSYYKEFAGMKDAERELGINQSHISECCKGKYKSAGKITINGKKEKIRWRYKEDK